MANGAFKFKDNSGNVVASIGSNGSNIVITGGTLDLSGMSGLTLGSVTLSGTTQNATSASHAASYLLTSSFNTYSGTTNTVIGTLQTSTGSLNSFTSSTNSRLNSIEGVSGSYATTGSNQFKNNQVITGSLTVTGFIDAQELRTTYISSSILYRSGSTKFGDESSDNHEFTGSLLVNGTGQFVQDVTIGNAIAGTNVKLLFNGVANKAAGIEFRQSGTPQWYLGNGIASEDNNFELYNSNGTMAMKIIKSTNAINFQGTTTFSNSVTGSAGINAIGQERAFTWQRTTGTPSDVYSINADSGASYLINNTTSNVLMYWLEGGNVGVGVVPTNSKMLIAGTHVSGNSILGVVPVGNQTATIGLYNSSNVRRGLLYSDTGFVRLETDADPLQLLSAGNLGLTIGTTGTATFASSVTATSFEVGNGQFFKARRSSSNLLIDLLGIESGTDNTRLLITGDFNIKNGSLSTLLNMTTAGAISLGANATGDSNPYSLTILRNGTLASPGTWLSTPAIKVEDISGDGPSSVSSTSGLLQLNLGRIADNDTFANNAFFINCVNDNGAAFVVTGKRNVGIGINTPQDRLDVNGSIRFRANTPNFTAVDNNGVMDYVPTSVDSSFPRVRIAAIGTSSVGAEIRFLTGTPTSIDNRMTITSGGTVGIGLTNPSSSTKLMVAGGIGFGNNTDGTANLSYGGRISAKQTSVTGGAGATLIHRGLGSVGYFIIVSGIHSSNRFMDLIYGTGGNTPIVLASNTENTSPTRTYSISGENIFVSLTNNSAVWTVVTTGLGAMEA